MSAVASVLRRAGAVLVEPAPRSVPAAALPLDLAVTALVAGAGATTVARGLALALGRTRPVELTQTPWQGAVAAGPGVTLVRDTDPAAARALRHRGPGRVLVAVADARREPAVAALVLEALAERNDRAVLVANRARDEDAWRREGALCLPDSRLGAWLIHRGRRPPGSMWAAFELLAQELEDGPEAP